MAWLTRNVRILALGALLFAITAPLAYGFYHQLYQKSLQAEARLIFSYVHTLQKVYKMEQGTYASFAYYGAPLEGQDKCAQPEGAAQLGFLLYGCHNANSIAPRYAYRSVSPEQEASGYQLEAEAGSDAQGRSLVCFVPASKQRLVSLQNGAPKVEISCW